MLLIEGKIVAAKLPLAEHWLCVGDLCHLLHPEVPTPLPTRTLPSGARGGDARSVGGQAARRSRSRASSPCCRGAPTPPPPAPRGCIGVSGESIYTGETGQGPSRAFLGELAPRRSPRCRDPTALQTPLSSVGLPRPVRRCRTFPDTGAAEQNPTRSPD